MTTDISHDNDSKREGRAIMNNKLHRIFLTACFIALGAISASAQGRVEFGIRGGLNLATQSTENTGWVSIVRDETYGSRPTDNFSASSRSGYQLGTFATFNLGSFLAIQPELLYTEKGIKVEGRLAETPDNTPGNVTLRYDLAEEIKLTYLEIPVLVKFRIPIHGSVEPSLFAGPAFAFGAAGREDTELRLRVSNETLAFDETFTINTDINNLRGLDIGLVVGGDIKIRSGSTSFILDARYTVGIRAAYKDIDLESLHNSLAGDTERPIADFHTGKASDAKNRALSITVGTSYSL